jgi:hypothetical protein
MAMSASTLPSTPPLAIVVDPPPGESLRGCPSPGPRSSYPRKVRPPARPSRGSAGRESGSRRTIPSVAKRACDIERLKRKCDRPDGPARVAVRGEDQLTGRRASGGRSSVRRFKPALRRRPAIGFLGRNRRAVGAPARSWPARLSNACPSGSGTWSASSSTPESMPAIVAAVAGIPVRPRLVGRSVVRHQKQRYRPADRSRASFRHSLSIETEASGVRELRDSRRRF